MRRVILLFALGGVVFGGWYLKNKLDSKDNSTSNSRHIPPASEWSIILTGSWNYTYLEKDDQSVDSTAGKITFDSRNTFALYVTSRLYRARYYGATGIVNDPIRICGGSNIGTWKIIDSNLLLTSSECHMVKSYVNEKAFINGGGDYEPCAWYELLKFGQYSNNDAICEIVQFDKDTIHYRCNYYSSGAVADIIFSK